MLEPISPELRKSPEKVARKYILHFGLGTHPFPLANILLKHPTFKEISRRFLKGALTAHA